MLQPGRAGRRQGAEPACALRPQPGSISAMADQDVKELVEFLQAPNVQVEHRDIISVFSFGYATRYVARHKRCHCR